MARGESRMLSFHSAQIPYVMADANEGAGTNVRLVVQAFADRYPERVRSVTVVGGYSIHRPSDKIKKAQRREAINMINF